MASSWFDVVTSESLNPKTYSFGNPGNTWNSRIISPKLHQVPRHWINSFTSFFFYIFYFLCTQRKKDWMLAIVAGHPPSRPQTRWDQEGMTFLHADFKQTLEKETLSKRRWCIRSSNLKAHQVRLWRPRCSCCPRPKLLNIFRALKLTVPPRGHFTIRFGVEDIRWTALRSFSAPFVHPGLEGLKLLDLYG